MKGLDGNTHVNYFEVKEYTVPRFEVTITAPKNFLPSHKSFTMKLCAKLVCGLLLLLLLLLLLFILSIEKEDIMTHT